MEKYTMFMDSKNQDSENGYTTLSNVQIQCNPFQATNGIFQRTRTNNFTIYMEIYPIQNKKFKVWGKKTQATATFFYVEKGKHKVSCSILNKRYSLEKQGCKDE